MSYTIQSFSCETALQNDEDWWRIYYSSFPACELEPKQAIFNCLKQQAGLTVSVRNKEGLSIGIAHGQKLNHFPIFMLIYMAIDATCRGQQIGKTLFNYVENQFPQGIIFEVDNPFALTNERDRHNAQRRIHFYQQLGYDLLPINYYQPPLKSNSQPVSMHLMAKHRNLSLQQKSDLVYAIYFEKYADSHGISAIPIATVQKMWERVSELNGFSSNLNA